MLEGILSILSILVKGCLCLGSFYVIYWRTLMFCHYSRGITVKHKWNNHCCWLCWLLIISANFLIIFLLNFFYYIFCQLKITSFSAYSRFCLYKMALAVWTFQRFWKALLISCRWFLLIKNFFLFFVCLCWLFVQNIWIFYKFFVWVWLKLVT